MKKILLLLVLGVFALVPNITKAESIDGLRIKAEQGDATAQAQLGFIYYFGEGVPQNFEEAVKWYRKSAEQGDAEAQVALGRSYFAGQGVPKDFEEAVKWFRKAAEQGDAEAQLDLGGSYYTGRGVPKDKIEALAWTNLAAASGNTKFMELRDGLENEIGNAASLAARQRSKEILNQMEKRKREATALPVPSGDKPGADVPKASGSGVFAEIRTKAEQGDATSQSHLGFLYYFGKGVSKNFEESVKWFRKAAEQGEVDAQFRLGLAYFSGEGVPQDFKKAFEWLRKAAERGNAHAQELLGSACYEGEVVPQDFEESEKWFRRAAEQGSANAQLSLGNAYRNGKGVRQDYGESVKWFRKAAEQGNVSAQGFLGAAYLGGIGVSQDFEESVKWSRMAAEQGDEHAQACLAALYHEGKGVRQDFEEAAKWFQKAAEQGNVLAQGHLGMCYEKGEGVPKDKVKALAWINLAATSDDARWMTIRIALENEIGPKDSLAARQRSREIQDQIEQKQQEMKKKKQEETALPVPSGDEPDGSLPKASGSGVFVSADGLLATTAHVVQGAKKIEVVTFGGIKEAELVQMDTANDVAILKCEGTFVPAPVGLSKKMKLGQTVFTLGFPNIELQGFSPKMTRGEISSLSGIRDDPRHWQISVPVQSGNSGGGLFDENGDLVGLVVSKLDAVKMIKTTGDVPENVNYAVKSSYLMPVLENCPGTLPPANSAPPESGKLEDVVGQCEKSAALILVY